MFTESDRNSWATLNISLYIIYAVNSNGLLNIILKMISEQSFYQIQREHHLKFYSFLEFNSKIIISNSNEIKYYLAQAVLKRGLCLKGIASSRLVPKSVNL